MPEVVDVSSPPAPPASAVLPTPTPGAATSEFSLTKIVMIVGTVVGVLFGLLSQLQGVIPGGTKTASYIAMALSALGFLVKILALLGYQSSRTQQKVASIAAAGDVATALASANVKTPADAAKGLS